ncbi:MAG: DUF368 domain-containing protein [Planctomycetes bacterium]|nr:DUF368 domain-containing protein [Planctomycetota bacterium]
MGAADIIPGVSGGTIAFVTGIYDNLVDAIASFDAGFVRAVLSLNFKEALARSHLRFLLPLLLGIGTAIVSMAKLMHDLMEHHPVPTWSLFFGLIAASIIYIGKKIEHWPSAAPLLALGIAGAYIIVGLIPVETPDAWWFIILCGMIAICAMILPGISGSFLLLILGKYAYVTGAVKEPFAAGSIQILLLFGLGCVVGITSFSRLLRFFLKHYHNLTMAVLTGFMIGAMRKVWPWKETIRQEMINGKMKTLEEANILPASFDSSVFFAIFLMIVGFLAVFILERFSEASFEETSKNTDNM